MKEETNKDQPPQTNYSKIFNQTFRYKNLYQDVVPLCGLDFEIPFNTYKVLDDQSQSKRRYENVHFYHIMVYSIFTGLVGSHTYTIGQFVKAGAMTLVGLVIYPAEKIHERFFHRIKLNPTAQDIKNEKFKWRLITQDFWKKIPYPKLTPENELRVTRLQNENMKLNKKRIRMIRAREETLFYSPELPKPIVPLKNRIEYWINSLKFLPYKIYRARKFYFDGNVIPPKSDVVNMIPRLHEPMKHKWGRFAALFIPFYSSWRNVIDLSKLIYVNNFKVHMLTCFSAGLSYYVARFLVRNILPTQNLTEGQKESICFGMIWVFMRKYFTTEPNIELLRPRYFPAYVFGFYGFSYCIDRWLYSFGRHQASIFDLYPELQWIRGLVKAPTDGEGRQTVYIGDNIIRPNTTRNYDEVKKNSSWRYTDIREKPEYIYMKELIDKRNNNPEEIKEIPPYYNLLEYLKYRHHQIWDPLYEAVELDIKYTREVILAKEETPENFAELDKAATEWEENKVQNKYGKLD